MKSREDIDRTPVVVILNPASGSFDEDARGRLEAAFRKAGVVYEMRRTSDERDAASLAREAREQGVRQVVACGGDGTVMGVINGLGANAESAPPVVVSIIPGGTANLLATSFGIPTDPDKSAKVAIDGCDREVDLGRRGGVLFALGIGVGLTEKLVSQANAAAKKKIGRVAYLLALVKELGAKPQAFTLKLDGGEAISLKGVGVVIANVADMGGGVKFAPDAKPDDGLLDVCVLARFTFLDLLRIAFRTLCGGLRKERELCYYQARKVELTADPPLAVQIDGEPVAAKTPVVAEIVPKALRIRVPNQNDEPKGSR